MTECKQCVYWVDKSKNFEGKDWGECRRHAPVSVTFESMVNTEWPFVSSDQGCGDGKSRDD